jgi:Uma2 family endonuclease
MVALTIDTPTTLPSGQIVAAKVSIEEYLEQYAETHHEWVKGVVIKMTPVSLRHTLLVDYLRDLFRAYFELNPIGTVVGEPFMMRLEATDSYREPDLQIILNDNPGQLTDTAMIGPADICIEIVSPESATRDYGDKFVEYETVGVREYWIIDPLRRDARFYQRTADNLYTPIYPDDTSHYHTPLLPQLALHVPTLWQDQLPGISAIVHFVQTQLEK